MAGASIIQQVRAIWQVVELKFMACTPFHVFFAGSVTNITTVRGQPTLAFVSFDTCEAATRALNELR